MKKKNLSSRQATKQNINLMNIWSSYPGKRAACSFIMTDSPALKPDHNKDVIQALRENEYNQVMGRPLQHLVLFRPVTQEDEEPTLRDLQNDHSIRQDLDTETARRGFFVETRSPLPVGTYVTVEVPSRNDPTEWRTLEGSVAYVCPVADQFGFPPGIGIRLMEEQKSVHMEQIGSKHQTGRVEAIRQGDRDPHNEMANGREV